jgi:hypothetical protein
MIMFAVGTIGSKVGKAQYSPVTIFVDGNRSIYMLDNEDVMPSTATDIGLFEFFRGDQYCSWVDTNKIENIEYRS